MIRIAIVDDEPLARARLRNLIAAEKNLKIVAECADGFEAVEQIRKSRPHIVFLDVQMPEMDGFAVVEKIGPENIPVVVFVTAYDQYALKAFQVHALDYLLKPFDEERFQETLRRAVQKVDQVPSHRVEQMVHMLQDWSARSEHLTRILIKDSERMRFLQAAEIDWIQADGNYVRIHTRSGQYTLRETIQSMESRLNPEEFLRIHRSTIVRIDRIKEIRTLFHGAGDVVLTDGTTLRLSRRYRDRLPQAAEKTS